VGAAFVVFERVVSAEAGSVKQQVFDGDGLFPLGCELGEVLGDGVLDGQFLVLLEEHDGGGGGNGLGQRGQVEDGVDGHGFGLRFEGAGSERTAEEVAFGGADEDDGAGDSAGVNGVVDGGFDGGKFAGIESDGGDLCGGLAGGCRSRRSSARQRGDSDTSQDGEYDGRSQASEMQV